MNRANGLTASTKQHNISLAGKNLFRYPIVYMHGRSTFRLSDGEIEPLRKYLKERGGVLFADACCGSREFDFSFRELMEKMFPDHKFQRIPEAHELFKLNPGFDIREVRRRSPESTNKNVIIKTRIRKGKPYLEGIEIDGRYVVIYSKHDISCAIEQQSSISCAGYVWKDAMKIAINVLMYAMLQDIRYSERVK